MPTKPLDQVTAIQILDQAWDLDDPAWENACRSGLGEPDYPKPSDGTAKDDRRFDRELRQWEREIEKLPTFGDVLLALGVPLAVVRKALRKRGGIGKLTAFSKPWRTNDPADLPNAPVVAKGVRGDLAVPRSVRQALGEVLAGARALANQQVVVDMRTLERLSHTMLVEFEVHEVDGERRLIPLPLYVDNDCKELTEEQYAAKNKV